MFQSRSPTCAVYIISIASRSVFVGATTDPERRTIGHKTKHFANSHSARYGIDRLVWWKQCDDWPEARTHELELKNMHRDMKMALPAEDNSKWQDLSYGLFHWSSSRLKRGAE